MQIDKLYSTAEKMSLFEDPNIKQSISQKSMEKQSIFGAPKLQEDPQRDEKIAESNKLGSDKSSLAEKEISSISNEAISGKKLEDRSLKSSVIYSCFKVAFLFNFFSFNQQFNEVFIISNFLRSTAKMCHCLKPVKKLISLSITRKFAVSVLPQILYLLEINLC